LHVAASVGSIQIAKLFILEGIDINAKISDGRIALHHAILNKHKEMAQYLIARGSNIHAKWLGNTPLHLAVKGGHEDIVKLLLANGADIDTKDNNLKIRVTKRI